MPNEPGASGRVLTTIEVATGFNLLLAYAYVWLGEMIEYLAGVMRGLVRSSLRVKVGWGDNTGAHKIGSRML